jgi:pullulanase
MTLTAEPKDESGNVVRGQQVFWSSSNTAVATVSNAGVVSALGSGEAQIAATAQGVSAVATIRVSDAPPVSQSIIARVVVSPPAGVVRASGAATFRQLQLTAIAYDADNRVVSGRSFVWSVDKGNVATVNGNGLVVAVKEGEAVVTATTGGVSGRSEILVLK